jgi:tellurite resistance protein
MAKAKTTKGAKAPKAQAISPQSALIYTMVLISAADRDMTDRELRTIADVVRMLPVFEGFDEERVPKVAAECAELLNQEDGLDIVLGVIKSGLPAKLRETAYALALEVAAADRSAKQEELRLLEMIRDTLGIELLVAAALERGARARYSRL